MGWADNYIKKLRSGETIQFRPRGNSMTGRIKSGQLVTVCPVDSETEINKGDIVLCNVGRRQYLHLVNAKKARGVPGGFKGWTYQISNNHGFINGWCGHTQVYGKVVSVE